MKTALLIAGFCRPNKEWCLETISLLKESFSKTDYKTIFIDDNNENSRFIANNLSLNDTIILLPRETDEEIDAKFPKVQARNNLKGWGDQTNIWRLREKVTLGLNFIHSNMPNTTHICIARPCTRVTFDPEKFNKEEYNVYQQTPFAIDDRFGFGPIEMVTKLWHYADKQILNEFEHVDNDEEFMRRLATGFGIPIFTFQPTSVILRPEA